MSTAKLRTLKNAWQADRHLQHQINAVFDTIGLDSKYVDFVTNRENERAVPRKSKQIKDNQWGMIEFDWRALRLIDCPIVQRLRYVKQLGFSYLTYPSAEHSRFSHSLGIGYVVEKFIEAISNRAKEAKGEELSRISYVSFDSIPGLSAQDVVHAALLHDVGHLPFFPCNRKNFDQSSLSFLCGGKSIEEILLQVNVGLDKSLPLSEILTLIFLLSNRFEQFYCNYVCVGDNRGQEALLTVCSLIAGLPPTPKLTGVSELISGAVDADKVDYVNRDALNCGIPVGVDVARVFLRSGVIRATRDQIKSLRLKANPAAEEYLFVINSSGLDTIDEILQARTALYQRVYFHAVTRTAERLFASAIESNAASSKPDPALMDALKLWVFRDVNLLERLLKSASPLVRRFGWQIANRKFPKKAYSFSPGLGDLQVPVDEILPSALGNSITEIKKRVNNTIVESYLREEHLWRGTGAGLEVRIRDEVKRVVKAIKSSDDRKLYQTYADQRLDCLLIVGNAHEKQIRHNPIICQNDRLLTVRDYTNAREQQDAFELLKEIGFVLCDEKWRPIIFIASRVVLARLGNELIGAELRFQNRQNVEKVRYITRFLPEYSASVLRSGVANGLIKRVGQAIEHSGYFDDKPWACEPMPADDARIVSIADTLKQFSGYRSWQVTAKSVAAYISQFPPGLRDVMVEALTELKVIDSARAVSSMAPMLAEFKSNVDIVPFSVSSGTQIQNWLRKELGANPRWRFPSDLRGALANGETNPLIFVDDNSVSAVQARAQFLSLLGIPRGEWPDECRSEDDLFTALTAEELQRLKRRDVYLFVCVGTNKADTILRSCLRSHGFSNFRGLRFAEPVQLRYGWPPALKKFLVGVGRSVGAWARYQKQYQDLSATEKAVCNSNALGYGNAGGWITTILSVPTGTITALWCPGLYLGQPWMPLLLRTNKLQHLIVG